MLSTFTSFQFQYGTIERFSPKGYSHVGSKFQFQYGTIERKEPYQHAIVHENFNSSMVRLKDPSIWAEKGVYNISIPVWYD